MTSQPTQLSARHRMLADIVVLETEDKHEFSSLIASFEQAFEPQSFMETDFVQTLAVHRWRYLRMRAIERAVPASETSQRTRDVIGRNKAHYKRCFARSFRLFIACRKFSDGKLFPKTKGTQFQKRTPIACTIDNPFGH